MRFTTTEVAGVTGGRAVGPERTVAGAAVDSRLVRGGELFVPLRAGRDGHDFIGAAVAAGAAAYLTEREPMDTGGGATAVLVADTSVALSALAAAARAHIDPLVVGITGSVGKTTTKDLAAAVLAARYVTHASPRSFNNEIGVPLTLVNAPADVTALVVELGARAAGHIAALCEVVQPSVGVVTRVAPVHTETFGTVEDVARAKRELVEALPAGGAAVLNADDPRVAAMARVAAGRVVWYGSTGDVRGEVIDLDGDLRPLVRITTPSGMVEARLSARGAHQLGNALAAIAVGVVAAVDAAAMAHALETAELSPQRMSLFVAPGGARVVDDTWNANPASVEAALRSLAALPARRRVAVLGAMAELGPLARDEHRRMIEVAHGLGVEVLAVEAPQYGVECVGIEDAPARLAELSEGDAVLIKGSRVAGLDRLVAALREGR